MFFQNTYVNLLCMCVWIETEEPRLDHTAGNSMSIEDSLKAEPLPSGLGISRNGFTRRRAAVDPAEAGKRTETTTLLAENYTPMSFSPRAARCSLQQC